MPGTRFWTRPKEGIDWLPRLLAEAGYTTLAVSANELAVPEEAGFDRLVSPRFVDWHRSVGGFVERRLPWDGVLGDPLRWRMPTWKATASSTWWTGRSPTRGPSSSS